MANAIQCNKMKFILAKWFILFYPHGILNIHSHNGNKLQKWDGGEYNKKRKKRKQFTI